MKYAKVTIVAIAAALCGSFILTPVSAYDCPGIGFREYVHPKDASSTGGLDDCGPCLATYFSALASGSKSLDVCSKLADDAEQNPTGGQICKKDFVDTNTNANAAPTCTHKCVHSGGALDKPTGTCDCSGSKTSKKTAYENECMELKDATTKCEKIPGNKMNKKEVCVTTDQFNCEDAGVATYNAANKPPCECIKSDEVYNDKKFTCDPRPAAAETPAQRCQKLQRGVRAGDKCGACLDTSKYSLRKGLVDTTDETSACLPKIEKAKCKGTGREFEEDTGLCLCKKGMKHKGDKESDVEDCVVDPNGAATLIVSASVVLFSVLSSVVFFL